MKPSKINWPELKKNYLRWRNRLWTETHKLFTISDRVELSRYNQLGYFHKVPNQNWFKQMQHDWRQLGEIPQKWISKGGLPGIWTAMFDSCNTFSLAKLPILIVRFYFKEGYFIFDGQNPSHSNLLKLWSGENRENPWKKLKNCRGESLEDKMKLHGFPSHKRFFEDNDFGAVLGYSDYISPIIVLEKSIKKIEFFHLKF